MDDVVRQMKQVYLDFVSYRDKWWLSLGILGVRDDEISLYEEAIKRLALRTTHSNLDVLKEAMYVGLSAVMAGKPLRPSDPVVWGITIGQAFNNYVADPWALYAWGQDGEAAWEITPA